PLVDGDPARRIDVEQAQPFAFGAAIVVCLGEVFEPALGTPAGLREMGPGQKLSDSGANQHDDHVAQHDPQFRIDRKAEHRIENVHDGQVAAVPGVSSVKSGSCSATPDGSSRALAGEGRKTALAVSTTSGTTPAMNTTSPGRRSHSMYECRSKNSI